MTKEEAIYKILVESDLAQKVKNRIYPLVAPYGVNRFPYIVYSQMSRYVDTRIICEGVLGDFTYTKPTEE